MSCSSSLFAQYHRNQCATVSRKTYLLLKESTWKQSKGSSLFELFNGRGKKGILQTYLYIYIYIYIYIWLRAQQAKTMRLSAVLLERRKARTVLSRSKQIMKMKVCSTNWCFPLKKKKRKKKNREKRLEKTTPAHKYVEKKTKKKMQKT